MVVIPYYPLGDEMLRSIISLQLERVSRRVLERYSVPLEYDQSVVELVAQRGLSYFIVLKHRRKLIPQNPCGLRNVLFFQEFMNVVPLRKISLLGPVLTHNNVGPRIQI